MLKDEICVRLRSRGDCPPMPFLCTHKVGCCLFGGAGAGGVS